MGYQTVFSRRELKYLLSRSQQQAVLHAMADYMEPDRYGKSTVRNIYFDTDSYRLIRRSLEKPVYKEKLRIRSYQQTQPDTPVFVELKKKYRDTVYKRRLPLPEALAMQWLTGQIPCPADTQIAREIAYTLQYYQRLQPTVFLSYDRTAYYCRDNSDLRITFDTDILCRQDALQLGAPVGGNPILPDGKVLMEIKTSGGIPLWLTRVLTEEKIYKASFSKYGTAYQTMIFHGGNTNA